MNLPETARPTPKMIRLYQHFRAAFDREPDDCWVFDPHELGSSPPPYLMLKHILVWNADQDCDVTAFQTLGMSERLLPAGGTFAELHFAVRSRLETDQRLDFARFLANVASYPFQWGLRLDWWEIIRDVHPIPGFPGCRHLLLHPRFTPESFDEIDDEEGKIKLLYIVPLTPLERHILTNQGREEFMAFVTRERIDLLADRHAPAEWYAAEERNEV
ncbi:MAG: suppressor of fused domain protein [Gemmataceae bacterium]